MHEPLLAQAALPAPEIVLGMLLRPYSIGHELFLIRERSPLLTSAAASRSALSRAVLICSTSWEEGRHIPFERFLGLKFWIWRRRTRNLPLNGEIVAFRRYRRAGSLEFPLADTIRPSGTPPRPPGAPFLLRLQQWLMITLNLSESQAWDYPLGLAKMRWATHWEQEAGLEIYNFHDAEFERFVAEQEAGGKESLCPA